MPLRQHLPNARQVFRLLAIGSGAIAFLTFLSIWLIHQTFTPKQKTQGVQAVEAKKPEPPPPKLSKEEAEKKAEEDDNNRVRDAAIHHWEEWEANFTNPTFAISCYHSHDYSVGYSHPKKYYKIRCVIGPKGWNPNTTVVCDQDLCKLNPPAE